MKKNNNIEEVLKDKFSSFTPEVPSSVWANVSSEIGANASFVSTLLGKVVIGAVAATGLIAAYTLTQKDPSKQINTTEIANAEEKVAQKKYVETKVEDKIETTISEIETSDNWEENSSIKTIKISEKNESEETSIIENKTNNTSVANLHITTKREIITLEDLEESINSGLNKDKASENVDNTIVTEEIEEIKTIEFREVTQDEVYASIKTNVVGGIAPLEVDFTNESSSGKATWTFDGKEKTTENNPTYLFTAPGKHTVKLEVTSENGTKATDVVIINVSSSSSVVVPNVFSPNGDGVNDYFFLKLEKIKSIAINITDMEFKSVFESTNINAKWDGLDKSGQKLPVGRYLCLVSAVGVDGKIYEEKKWIYIK